MLEKPCRTIPNCRLSTTFFAQHMSGLCPGEKTRHIRCVSSIYLADNGVDRNAAFSSTMLAMAIDVTIYLY